MSQYSWLADRKREAIAAKLQQRGLPNYRQKPIREQYGVSYTGTGADGNVDRSAPAGIAGAPGQQHLYHEGEMRAHTPEGNMYVNADVTQKMMMAPTDQDNMEMNMNKKTGNLPGYALGGYAPYNNGMLVQPTQRQGLANTAANLAGQISNQVNNTGTTSISGTTRSDTSGRRRTSSTAVTDTPIPVAPIQTISAPVIKTPTAPNFQPVQIAPVQQPTISGQIPVQSVSRTAPTIEPAQIAPIQTISGSIPGAETNKTVSGEIPVKTAPTVEPAQLNPNLAGQKPPPVEPPPAAETPTAIEMQGRKTMDELSARQQQERSAAEQRAIQEGVDPNRARLEGQILRDKQESELNTAASQFGIADAQFKAEEEKYKDSQDWIAYKEAIISGDFKTAAEAYQRVTGNPISMEQMTRTQNYMNTKQDQDVKLGEQSITMGGINISSAQVALEAQKFGLESAKFAEVIKQINNGVTDLAELSRIAGKPITQEQFNSMVRDYKYAGDVQTNTLASLRNSLSSQEYSNIQNIVSTGGDIATVNAELARQGKPPMTDLQYAQMLDASPIGARNYERRTTAMNALLAAGGKDNIDQYAKMFADLFPGVPINVDRLKDADTAKQFTEGQSALAEYASTDIDFDSIPKNALEDIAKKTGMKREELETFYNSLRVNTIDQQIRDVVSSEAFKSLSPEIQGLIRESFTLKTLGVKGVAYLVKDSNGKIVNAFSSASEAATWMEANKDKGYSVGMAIDTGEGYGEEAEDDIPSDDSEVSLGGDSAMDNLGNAVGAVTGVVGGLVVGAGKRLADVIGTTVDSIASAGIKVLNWLGI